MTVSSQRAIVISSPGEPVTRFRERDRNLNLARLMKQILSSAADLIGLVLAVTILAIVLILL